MLDIIRGKSQSLITKVIFGLIILAFIFLGVGNFSGSSRFVIASVNDKKISEQDYGTVLQGVYEQERGKNPGREIPPAVFEQIKNQVLSSMIQEELMYQEAVKLGLFVSPYELLGEISKIGLFQNDSGKFDPERYNSFLQQSKQTPAQFEARFLRQMLVEKLVQTVVSSVNTTEAEAKIFFNFIAEQRTAEYVLFSAKDYIHDVTLEESDVALYYENHKATFTKPAEMNLEYIVVTPKTLAASIKVTNDEVTNYYASHQNEFTEPAQYKVSHIFLSAPPDFEQDTMAVEARNTALSQMKEIQQQISEGVSFADLAKTRSDDKESAVKGGELDWIAAGVFPAFDVALELSPGEVSGIVQTPVGYHLLLLKDIKPAIVKPLAEVKKIITEEVALQKAQNMEKETRAYVNEELGKGTDFATIGKHLSLPVETTGVVEKANLSKLLGLHADAVVTIENIPVGETSPAPVNVVDGIALIKVLASTPDRQLELDEVKGKIEETLKADKAAILARTAASDALALFTKDTLPVEFKGKEKVSQPFSRILAFVPPLTNSALLAENLGMATKGEWMSQIFEVGEGTVIARVKDIIPPTEKDWEIQGSSMTRALEQSKQQDLMQAFLSDVTEKSKITTNPEALAAIQLNR